MIKDGDIFKHNEGSIEKLFVVLHRYKELDVFKCARYHKNNFEDIVDVPTKFLYDYRFVCNISTLT